MFTQIEGTKYGITDEYGNPIYNTKITYNEPLDEYLISFYENPVRMGYNSREHATVGEKKRDVSDPYYSDYVLKTNLIHTKQAIYEYAANNEWQYFATFTIAPEQYQLKEGVRKDRLIDRYDYEKCRKVLSKWLQNTKERYSKDLRYLIIAEYHKDKAIHFHGLIGNLSDEVQLIPHGEGRYHTKLWKYGRHDLSEIKDKGRVVTYMTKYITKDIINKPGKSRYIASRGLKRCEYDKFYLEGGRKELYSIFKEEGADVIYCRGGKNSSFYYKVKINEDDTIPTQIYDKLSEEEIQFLTT